MERPVYRKRRTRGFTLVEIVISIFIVVLLLGMVVLSVHTFSDQRRLREVSSSLMDYAKQARSKAVLERRAFQIAFQPTHFAVQGMRQVTDEEFAMGSLFLVEGEAARAEELARFEIPEDMTLEILRWNTDKWQPAPGHAWVFEQSGICEPLSIRINSPAGYIAMRFNPLTANVEEEEFEIR